MTYIGFAVFAAVFTAWITAVVRRRALATGMMDVPNARSSHRLPTPRGGGLAIALATILLSLLAMSIGLLHVRVALALLTGGVAVAVVGYADDRFSLSARVRFAVHLLACTGGLVVLGGYAGAREMFAHDVLNALFDGLLIVGWVWLINLFNFMDGTDGIAAAETIFVAAAIGLLLLGAAAGSELLLFAVILGSSCAGFLKWNWAPAAIFMGDVGSGFIGYACGLLLLAAMQEGSLSIWTAMILTGAFLVDATVTLLVRMLSGQRWFEAHRSHAYQHLAQRWRSHARVAVAYTVVNVAWLLPMGWLSHRQYASPPILFLVAMVPLLVAALMLGAGLQRRPE